MQQHDRQEHSVRHAHLIPNQTTTTLLVGDNDTIMTKQPIEEEDGESEQGEKRPAENPVENTATAARRIRRDWLAAPTGGRRQPRIGNDFQVSILPNPSDFSATTTTTCGDMETKPDK